MDFLWAFSARVIFATVKSGICELISPASSINRAEKLSDFIFQDTDTVGPYRATWEGGARRFASHVAPRNVKRRVPRAALRSGSRRA